MKHYISLGAGVQSSAMCLMAAKGLIDPMPLGAIFADTQSEPQGVYTWLEWLKEQLPFPVYTVTAGDMRNEQLRLRTSKKTGNRYVRTLIPAFVDQGNGKRALMGRKCTAEYKVRQIVKEVRRVAEIKRAQKEVTVTQWIGISTDEASRMKDSQVDWSLHRWPLIEMGMSRQDCLQWMADNGYPEPPRSACTFCPFHGDNEWTRLKEEEPEEFAKVIEFERELQNVCSQQTGTAKFNGQVYLHSSLKNIDEVDFDDTPEKMQLNLFGNECEGLCGV